MDVESEVVNKHYDDLTGDCIVEWASESASEWVSESVTRSVSLGVVQARDIPRKQSDKCRFHSNKGHQVGLYKQLFI